jgi:hypothetical protein
MFYAAKSGMKALPKILLALTAVAALSVAYPARANFIATIDQVGTNVVVTGSGTIDLTALSFITPAAAGAAIAPSGAYLVLATGNVAVYTGFSGPTSFGSGGVTFASSNGGNAVGIEGGSGELFVPQGYVSGAALSGTSTYAGATLLSLGVTPGTYTWTWGTGVHADSFTINAGVGVPDAGSTLPLLGFALLGLAALRRKLSC